MSIGTNPGTPKPKLPVGIEPRILSFDVYGTLINTPPSNLHVFQSILLESSETNLDPMEFYSFWEQRNIAHYVEEYKIGYKDICQISLSEAFRHFSISSGREALIVRYFECFSSMQLYPDVQPTLDILASKYRLALVSNIDDDLLNMTSLGRRFDLVCTAERARGYKPDGTLFRYLIQEVRIIGFPDPAFRAIAVYRHGRRQAFGPHHCLDQQA